MKRRRYIYKLIVFLLAGAIINIAVAWGCALRGFGGKNPDFDGRTSQTPPWWSIAQWREFGLQSTCGTARGLDYDEPRSWAHCPGILHPPCGTLSCPPTERFITGDCQNCTTTLAGWPAFALYHERMSPLVDAFTRVDDSKYSRGVWTWRSGEDAYHLPLLPIWRGLAINTIFYAAILWMLFAAPFAWRRWRRITRGQCTSCGYSLRGSSTVSQTCPECGCSASSPR